MTAKERMNLLPLSLVRVTKGVPPVPTNDQRARLYRAAIPSPTYNEYDWPHCRRRAYELSEMMDGREPSDDIHYRSR